MKARERAYDGTAEALRYVSRFITFAIDGLTKVIFSHSCKPAKKADILEDDEIGWSKGRRDRIVQFQSDRVDLQCRQDMFAFEVQTR